MIYKVIILSLCTLTALGLIFKYTIHDHSSHTHAPTFKAKECFLLQYSPPKYPDGIVMYHDDFYYYVLWRKEAELRYAGPKAGDALAIKWLDEYASHIKCPKGWVKDETK